MNKYVNINDKDRSSQIINDILPTLYKATMKLKINNKESDALPYKIKIHKNYITNIYKNFGKIFSDKKSESLVKFENAVQNDLLSKTQKNIETTNNSLNKMIGSKIDAGSMILYDLKECDDKTLNIKNIKQKYLSLCKNYVFTPSKDIIGNHFINEKSIIINEKS